MKLPHTAALALVGWYLMVPPGPIHPNPQLPAISTWFHEGSFDTAEECESMLFLKESSTLAATKPSDTLDSVASQIAAEHMLAQCIASDDPRLKEK